MKDNMHYLFLVGPVIGTCLEIGGFYWKKSIINKHSFNEKTKGKVVSIESKLGVTGFDTSGRTVYYPIIEFSIDGEVYTTSGSIASTKPKYSIGDEIDVSYNPATPGNSELSSEEFIFPHALMLIGAVFIFMGTIAFISISLIPNL